LKERESQREEKKKSPGLLAKRVIKEKY